MIGCLVSREFADMLDTLRQAASEQGFVLCGVAPAVDSSGYSELLRWIESGYAGEMDYFLDRRDAYRHPSGVLAGARSIVALAYPYDATASVERIDGFGKVARYAWSGRDYHDTIHPKLKRLCQIIQDDHPQAAARGVVDTAPLMEREVGQLAGLGWQGKNTLLLNKGLGSYFFLACLLTDVELPYDKPHAAEYCGTCTACLDACPTAAFPTAGVLDATRCISYLTIEHRGHIDRALRPGIGDWLFGCDVCQEVCPWNRKPSRRASRRPKPLSSLQLIELFSLDEDQFRDRFRHTPLWRTRRRGVLRNAAIVLGNQANAVAIPALSSGLDDREPIVRGASAWALAQIGSDAATEALRQRQRVETDAVVLSEIEAALAIRT